VELGTFTDWFSGMRKPNFTKLGEDIWQFFTRIALRKRAKSSITQPWIKLIRFRSNILYRV